MHASLGPGVVVAGRYRVEGTLGAGGFGVVLRATQLTLGREVALKVISSPLDRGASERFLHEARTAQRLEHPNTVRILDLGELGPGVPFIVFELLRGETVAERLARAGALPAWVALRITAQVLKSLMEAHGQGIIHRDIKPANLFLASHPGEPVFAKVLDFGVAKQLWQAGAPSLAGAPAATRPALAVAQTSPALTRADEVVGTPLYMSPEQARAEQVQPSSDLYALGLVLGEMVLGRPLVDPALGPVRVAMAHAGPEALELPPPLYTTPVAAIVRRATDKDATRRYGSATDMLAHVEEVLATVSAGGLGFVPHAGARVADAMFAPTLAAPFTPRIEGTSAARRPVRRTWAFVLGGVAMATMVALGGAALLIKQRTEARTVNHREAPDDEAEPSDPFMPPPVDRKLDLSRRGLAVSNADEIIRTLREGGYKVERLDETQTEHLDMLTLSAVKPPCGGSVIIARYRDAVAQKVFVEQMAAYGLVVEDGGRALYVKLTSLKDEAEVRRRCSVPVMELLTAPR